MISGNHRFIADTPHGRFGTQAHDGHYVLVFKSRRPAAKPDTVWLKTQALVDYQKRRLTRLGFVVLGDYKATECVDDYIGRRQRRAAEEAQAAAAAEAAEQA